MLINDYRIIIKLKSDPFDKNLFVTNGKFQIHVWSEKISKNFLGFRILSEEW